MTASNLGQYIYGKCEEAKIPVAAVALNGGFNPSILSLIKRGSRNPTPKNLREIAHGVGVISQAMEDIRVEVSRLQAEGGHA